MIINNIIVITENHYFSQGILSLFSERDSVKYAVLKANQVNRQFDAINEQSDNTLCIVDVNHYFFNILVYFDVMSTLMDAKMKSGSRLHLLLCNNTSLCLPSATCYSLVSLVITGRGADSLRQTVRMLLESSPVPSLTVKTGNARAIGVLTQMEYGVLTALSREQSVNEVADKYQISPKSVSRHKCSGLRKLQKKRL